MLEKTHSGETASFALFFGPESGHPRWKFARNRLFSTASLAALSLAVFGAREPVQAQQVIANGTSQTAAGTINTGVLGPSAGYALYALNNGVIQSFSPLTLITGGGSSNAARAESGGSISLFSGSSVTTNGNAVGLSALGAGSSITALNTTVSTAGTSSHGASATQGSSQIILTGGSVQTTGTASDGLFAFGSTAVATITATNVAITTGLGGGGAQSNGVEANLLDTVNLTGGSVSTYGSTAYGFYTIGSGATLNADGTVVSTHGANSIGAYAVQGQMVLNNVSIATTGNGAEGAVVDNASRLTITGGSVTTSGTTANGLRSTTGSLLTATGVSISTTGSGTGATAQFGGRLVLNGGSVTTAGPSSVGLFAVGLNGATGASIAADGTSVTTSGTSSHGVLVRGGSSVTLTGTTVATLGPGAAALFSSTFDPGASTMTIQNSALSSAQGFGVFATGTTLNASLNSASLRGGGGLLGVASNGILNLTAASSTLTGTATTETGSTSNLTLQTNSVWNMPGTSNLTRLVNDASLIAFAAPTGDPTQLASYKTLTTGNYTGVNGTLGLNTHLDTDGSPSDRLVINGGTASGSSLLRIANAGGGGAQTTGNGILVVDTINGGTTVPTAFALARQVAAGPYDYTLFRSSVDASNAQAWYLRSTLDCSLLRNAAVCPPSPPGPAPAPQVPDYRPETSFYAAIPSMALLYGRNLLDTLHERVGEEDDLRGRTGLHRDAPYTGGWARMIGIQGKQDGDPRGIYGSGPQFNYDFLALQGGTDLSRREHADGSRDHLGVMFAVGHANGNVTHFDGATGNNAFQAYSFGGYWTHFGATGWFLDTVLQGTRYDVTSSANRALAAFTTHGDGIAGSIEAGYPVRFANGYFIEPQAQLIYQQISFDAARDTAALVKFSDVDSLVGRVGARIGRTWSVDGNAPGGRLITVWIRPNVGHEFRGNPLTQFSSDTGFIPFRAALGGNWGEINAGVSGQVRRDTTLFANASYQERFDRKGFAYNGKAGVRLAW